MLNNTRLEEYDSDRDIVEEDTCMYVLKKISFTVGVFSTCEIPRERNCTVKAELINFNH